MLESKTRFIVVVAASCAALWGSRAILGDIRGSGHDFSDASWSNGEICLPCHTPHNSNLDVARAPLWNHELTTATYTLYDGTSGVSFRASNPLPRQTEHRPNEGSEEIARVARQPLPPDRGPLRR